jgi:hypothetical protein
MKSNFVIIILLCCAFNAFGQGPWELKRDENGIQVFTRNAAKGNVKELRVTCELDATKAQLINTLENIDGYNSWVYSNKRSNILKMITPQNIIYYTQSHLPWPIRDRDLVVQLTITPTQDVLNVQAKSLPDYLPKNANYVRVPYSLATWKVTEAPDNKLKVDYTFSIDPGGNIPTWLVNATMAIGPYNSFAKLREILKSQRAQQLH